MIELLSDPQAWISLASLALLEIVLGIDNIVFIAILTDRLPEKERALAYKLGLGGAMITRILLLLALNWLQHLEGKLFAIDIDWWLLRWYTDISGRDLVLLFGGLFLMGKSVHEIYTKVEKVEDEEEALARKSKHSSQLFLVIGQIMVLDIVFSLDSVITAVGIADHVEVMIAAIVLAVLVMLLFAQKVGRFVNSNPSMKILALSFLLLIGVLLTGEAFDQHIEKGYIYFGMAFALGIELLNMRFRKKKKQGIVYGPGAPAALAAAHARATGEPPADAKAPDAGPAETRASGSEWGAGTKKAAKKGPRKGSS
jgi:predicted tellurium resistance membrane protein TerC